MDFSLTKKLPETVLIDGAAVEINTDFRTSIEFELLLQDDTISDEERVGKALYLYYPRIPKNLPDAVEQMIWFYTCGQVDKRTKSSKVLYRFDCDSSYIYSAFLSQYRLDLQELPYMHWWKFRSLLQGLSEDNEFIKIIGYRAMEISSKMTSDQKRFYKKMKEQHKIPMSEKKSCLISEVEEALMNGGDISQLLGR
jgi:hypothetical protein